MAQTDCPHCQGSGWKVVERTTQGAQPLASADSARLGSSAGEPKMVWAVPCDCTTGGRPERALQRARIPERYRHCDFENYETDNDIEGATEDQLRAWNHSLSKAKVTVRGFVREFPSDTAPGLLLMGPCGVGKTHLAVAALKEVALRGHTGLFYDYRELLKEIQDSYNPESQSTEMGVLDPVLKTEMLVLDDVGSSKPSPWALETVGHLLNTRYNERRVTILTTNFFDSDPSANSAGSTGRVAGMRAPATEDSLTDRLGKRIRSRLYEMCRKVEISAADYRKEILKADRFRA
jgi:DNA replication protein DnaC